MFYKIQPEQIQLHNFYSASGDVSFSTGENYVNLNLSRYLTGDFNISGSLKINNRVIPVSDSSNSTAGSNSFVFGGVSNTISGTSNVSLNGKNNEVYGSENTAINSINATFSQFSKNNTAIGGGFPSFGSGVSGAAIFADSYPASTPSNGSNTLTLSYRSGIFVDRGNLNLNGNLIVGGVYSGLFMGDLNVMGTPYNNGVRLATMTDLSSLNSSISGSISSNSGASSSQYNILSGNLETTGQNLSTRIINTGDSLFSMVNNTGAGLSSRLISTGSSLSTRIGSTGASLDSRLRDTGSYLFGLINTGAAEDVSTRLIATGSGLDARLIATGQSLYSGAVGVGESMMLNGETTVMGSLFISPISGSFRLPYGESSPSTPYGGINGQSNVVPTGWNDTTGTWGQVAYSGRFLYVKISSDGSPSGDIWVRHSGTWSW